MEVNWKYVESTVQPLEIDDQSSLNGIYIHTNITVQTKPSSDTPVVYYTYNEAFFTREEYAQYIEDIADTPEYKKTQRLKEIDKELTASDVAYSTVQNTPVKYTNGHTYKPVYIDSYVLLIASGLSYEIWSDDEVYSEIMDTAALTTLCMFLKGIAEPAYQVRKVTRKALIEEKSLLES